MVRWSVKSKNRSKRLHANSRVQLLDRASDICRLPTSRHRRRRGGEHRGVIVLVSDFPAVTFVIANYGGRCP